MIAFNKLITIFMTVCSLYHPVKTDLQQWYLMQTIVAMKATAYTGGTVTKDGSRPREGICASSMDHIGETAIVYKRLPDGDIGEIIGIYEIKDTGGKGVKKGTVLDVYRDNLERCNEFMRLVGDMNIYVQYIDAKG